MSDMKSENGWEMSLYPPWWFVSVLGTLRPPGGSTLEISNDGDHDHDHGKQRWNRFKQTFGIYIDRTKYLLLVHLFVDVPSWHIPLARLIQASVQHRPTLSRS